jgi:hypothetical protein
MRHTFRLSVFVLLFFLGNNPLLAQTDSVEKLFAFKITGYIKPVNDTFSIVQVFKPASLPVTIPEKQLGVLYKGYKPGEPFDTAVAGFGRCNLVKGAYYYFGIQLKKMITAAEGDLLYIKTKIPCRYDGLLLNVMKYAIHFTNVYGEDFMNYNAIFTNAKEDEQHILDSMVRDIRFTGTEMLKQMPDNNKVIQGGIFDGKKLFEAMQAVTPKELESFLKFINARPAKYAGNNWKISEIFATWMDGGSPAVIEN